jgi:hypothetical protein
MHIISTENRTHGHCANICMKENVCSQGIFSCCHLEINEVYGGNILCAVSTVGVKLLYMFNGPIPH